MPVIELRLASDQAPWAPDPQPSAGTRRSLGQCLRPTAGTCPGAGDPAVFLAHSHSEGFGSFPANVKMLIMKSLLVCGCVNQSVPFEKALQ